MLLHGEVLENPKFGPLDIAVYTAVSYFEGTRPSHQEIAETAGCSVRKARESLELLEETGLISIDHAAGNQTDNEYSLRQPPASRG